MNFRSALSYLFILVTLFVALAQAKVEEEKPSSKFESESIDAAKPVDPAAKIKYYIEFNEEVVKQEEMDAVVDWLKARSIKPEEVEMASYMAYIIAEMDKSLGTAQQLFYLLVVIFSF